MDLNIEELRAQTRLFIWLDPTEIVITRPNVTKVAGGTRVTQGPPRQPQTVKLIWPGGTTSGIISNFDGEDSQYDLILVAEHGSDIQIGDEWLEDGDKYVVKGLAPDNYYELKASIKVYGRGIHGG